MRDRCGTSILNTEEFIGKKWKMDNNMVCLSLSISLFIINLFFLFKCIIPVVLVKVGYIFLSERAGLPHPQEIIGIPQAAASCPVK